MPWVKGQSGNPAGRPKGSLGKNFGALIRHETRDCAELVEIALEVARSPSAEHKDRLRAVEWLASYAIGKPVERVELDATVESFDPLAGTSAERGARVRQLLDQAGIVLKRVPVAAGAD